MTNTNPYAHNDHQMMSKDWIVRHDLAVAADRHLQAILRESKGKPFARMALGRDARR